MSRRPSITPTDAGRPNPDWRYSPPRKVMMPIDPCNPASPRIPVVEVDAMQLAMLEAHYRAAGVPLAKDTTP